MASTSQVGRGLGSVLGLALGITEGDRRRKKRQAAKADLDEKQLQELREKELQAARRKAVFEGILAPEQERNVLSSDFGIEPTQKQQFLKNIRGGIERGETRLDPNEAGIFREEQERERLLSMLQRFGIKGTSAVQAGATGAAEISGLGRTLGDIAKQGLTEETTGLRKAQTKTQESIQKVNEAREKSFSALAGKRERVVSAKTNSEKRLALNTLQKGYVARIKSLESIIKADVLDLSEGTQIARQDRNELVAQLEGVTKELKELGGVQEGKSAEVSSVKVDRITTLQTMLRKGLISEDNFKKQIKALSDSGVPRETIFKALGL